MKPLTVLCCVVQDDKLCRRRNQRETTEVGVVRAFAEFPLLNLDCLLLANNYNN